MTDTESNKSRDDQIQLSKHSDSEKEVMMIKYFTIKCTRVVIIIFNKTLCS